MPRYLLPLILIFVYSHSFFAQDMSDLLNENDEVNYAKASFKTNRVINLHSLENTAHGVMDVKISHRFGVVKNGVYDLFGIDAATQRIGIDYGVTDNLCVGVNRNSVDKAYDGFLKYRILRQSKGKKNVPITLSALTSAAVETVKYSDNKHDFKSRLYYTNQLIIGRKFNDWLTLQLVPSHVHRNAVLTADEKWDVFACGIGGRIRLTRRTTFNAEYIYVLPNQLSDQYKNSLSVGFDIETGGHVFQLHFTNSTSMSEYGFITKTEDSWADGNIRFGFNVSRVFTLYDPKKN